MNETERALVKHYDKHPSYYTLSTEPHLSAILEQAGAAGSMLDIGCGTGGAADWAQGNYLGIDCSPNRIYIARTKRPRKRFVVGDVYDTDFESGWDVAWCSEVLEHLWDCRTVWDKMLASANLVVATVPVDLPYKAHLQVFKEERDVAEVFRPDRVWRYQAKQEHFVFCKEGMR